MVSFVEAHSFAYLNQLLFFLLILQLLECARRIVVQDNQIAIAHVEPAQMIARVFRVVNVLKFEVNRSKESCLNLIDNIRRALCIRIDAESDLA